MSTISSNADINTKYQRVAAEYAKLKVQISTLKNAVIAEQAKNEKLSIDLHNSESTLRKLESEKEGFEFRNSQLMKRVESLQNEIDDIKQASVKKRGLLFQKSARTERSVELDNEVLQMELQKKVAENETLHKKISELENEYTETTSALNEQYRNLEIENEKLKEELKRIRTNVVTDRSMDCNAEKSEIQLAAENISMVEAVVTNNQNLVLNSEGNVAMRETLQILWLDALRIGRMLAAGFANLLQLFEQRSTIYPNDSKMEKLPDRTLLYGRRLLSSCDMFEACSSNIENILVKSVDDDCRNLSDECSEIISEWQELFCENNANENRVSWCGTNLSKCNEEWTASFLIFLRSLIVLSRQIECSQSALELFTLIEKLSASLADCSRVYTAKIFNENRIPTATKRLCCVNECINNCLTSLHRNLNRFIALVQLIMNSNQLKEENIFPENKEVACLSLEPALSNGGVKVLINENDDETEQKEQQKSKSTRSATDFWKSEMESATKRIIELEKEKERIIVNYELLKTKLESLESGIDISEFPCKDAEVICSYFEERIGDLHADIQHIRSRAFYYKHECKDLLKLAKLSKQESETLREELSRVTARELALKEELEMTRKSYEMQLQNLHEHVANLNTRLDEQSKALNSFKDVFNGVTSTKQESRNAKSSGIAAEGKKI
uniref:Coiled-coil domain-containing protein 128 n=1 Tax=Onchocerca volvulus TaxID=6282 RepID=A0A8R1TVI6_ONCVO